MENRDLLFYGLLDFYPNKERIKQCYQLLEYEEKRLFKKDVYTLCFEKDYIKDLIWEYLNDWEPAILDLPRQYRLRKYKIEKRESQYSIQLEFDI